MSGNASKEPSGKKKNQLMHTLNPKQFVRLFTMEKCTFEDKLIKEILKCICALRNSGGGKLTIWFTETCLMLDAEECVKIINKAVDEVLSETRSTDLLEWKFSNRIIFLVSGSKEIVTMKYNIYIMTNEILQFVPSSKSAEDMRLYFHKQKKHLERDDYSESKQHQVQVCSQKKKSRFIQKKRHHLGSGELLNESKQRKFCQTIKKETKSIVLPEREIERELLLDQVQLVKGQQFKVPTTKLSQIKLIFKILEDNKLCQPQNKVAFRITLEKNELLAYVSGFANHLGGELYYGVSSRGIILGEKILETEMKEIHQIVEKKMASMMWPQHVEKINKFWTIAFLSVEDQNDVDAKIYVIKISVKPCHGGVFIDEPESYYVVENRVEILPFQKWIVHLQNSTTELSGGTASIEFKEDEMAFDEIFLPNAYETFLERLEWVESFKIVNKNDECDVRHLEIVCRFGEVPRTADIVKFFGEDILPFITYQKGSKREWFETKIFNEKWDMKEEYEDKLMSLPWVEEFYIGVASEPVKSWQIYISCAQNNLPSMVDLKKLFGVDMASFVDFIPERTDEESLSSASFLRGPVSGDELCVQEEKGGYGTIGILTGDSEKHYATTCYHVCFKKDLPENDIDEGHRILMQDYKDGSRGCKGSTCVYITEHEERQLGQFCHGLYDNDNDIALIELDADINCSEMVERLEENNIKPVLANKKEVKDMLRDMGELPVEIIRPLPLKGKLYSPTGVTRCRRSRRCYRIRTSSKKTFASKGDSGSLVFLEYDGEKIPFAYLCMAIPESGKTIYYCRSLDQSMEELIKNHNLPSGMKPCSRECTVKKHPEVEAPENDVENDAEDEDEVPVKDDGEVDTEARSEEKCSDSGLVESEGKSPKAEENTKVDDKESVLLENGSERNEEC